MATLTFHGATETVTGSKYLLQAAGGAVLFDCGVFQGLKELRERNWAPLPFDAKAIDAIVLTHAHIDHIGFLPRVVKFGYRGPVYCTPATFDLAEIMLYDAANNQESDADYANRKGYSKHSPAEPLFDNADVSRTLDLLQSVERETWFEPAGPIRCRYHDTGHLLGSAMIEVEIAEGASPRRLLFSGDVGRYGAPLYHDPRPPTPCDYLVCESTYGDREHDKEDPLDQLCEVASRALLKGGVILVPCFAVGRAQQLIYLLQVLIESKRLPEMPIYLDSPMSVNATNIYARHAKEHDLSEGQLKGSGSVLGGKRVHLSRTVAESKRINGVRGPAVILSSAGMMTGGRILHHLKQRLPDPKNTILLGGFMAAGTRGRLLQDGAKSLRIHGIDVPVNATVEKVSSLSGHAGRSELLRWLKPLADPRRVFLTHGELSGATSLADELRKTRGWNTSIPKLGESVELA